MKRFTLALCLLTVLFCSGQNKINSYEYWFDGDYSARILHLITRAQQYYLDTGFASPSLTPGLHSLNIRFKDDSSKYSETISNFFYKKTDAGVAGTLINAYQYWFDNNIAGGVLQPVTATASFTLTVGLAAAALDNGLHLFHIRVRDINNQWSSTTTQFMYKKGAGAVQGLNQVNAYQYWFNSQVSQAQTVALSPAEQLQLSAAISTRTIAKGLQIMHIRFRDITNQWSGVSSQFIYVNDSAVVAGNGISKMQYWFDTVFTHAKVKIIPLQPVVEFNELLSANELSNGLHTIHFRFKDTIGQWSSTQSQLFYKSDSSSLSGNRITGYRYWLNDYDSTKIIVHNTTPESILLLNTAIDLGCLPEGYHKLHLQFKDEKGMWSSALNDTILLIPVESNIYRFIGNGNWSNAANWQNNSLPPLDLPGCKEIIIDHIAGGQCILDIPQYLLKSSHLTVLSGKNLIIPKQLEMK